MVAIQPLTDGAKLGLDERAVYIRPEALVTIVERADSRRKMLMEVFANQTDPLLGEMR